MDWRSLFDTEISKAEQARLSGNEGRARVCARRAAGLVVRAYYDVQGSPAAGTNALDLLKKLGEDRHLDAALGLAVQHLTARVDEAFQLPPDVDLIADARTLREQLLH